MVERIGVYPGTFDPITNGHLDIIVRATRVVDHLIIGVAGNDGKGPLFPLDQRVDMVRDEIAHLRHGNGTRIEVRPFSILLVDFVRSCNATVIVRGLRAVSDFEYEFQMAAMNTRICPTIETVFLMASERCQFISSRFVKEIGRLGGDISSFVPPRVLEHLAERYGQKNGAPVLA
ncbi:MAG: pantetheine-phosphate adenylyltransferase [Alphaproteobacteria bacterium]